MKQIIVHNPNNLPTVLYTELVDLQGNLKITDDSKIEKLKNSIIKYGIFTPKFLWLNSGKYYIMDGHQTVKALCSLEVDGYDIPEIPYVLIKAKDRKDAGEKLLQINSRYGEINFETDFFERFDIDIAYLEEIEIPELEELVFKDEKYGEIEGEDDIPEEVEPICKTGDLWQLGEHRLLCNDCTIKKNVERLMGKNQANMVFCDPPYGLNYEYNSYKDIHGNDYLKMCDKWFGLIKKYPLIMITTGWKYMSYWWMKEPKDIMFWLARNKQTGGTIFYFRRIEPIFVWGKPTNKFNFDFFEETTDRMNGLRESHTCPKPVKLITDIVQAINTNEIVLDLFLGSGTTLIACEKSDRICYGLEIDPKYCDVIIQRYVNFTGNNKLIRNGKKYIWQ